MSTSGGSAWNKINGDSIKYGYVVSAVSGLYQVGSWYGFNPAPSMALVRSPGDAGPWTRSVVTADSSEAKAFAVSTSAPNVLYVGGYVGLGDGQWSSHYACLFKSTNTGATWTRLGASVFTSDRECVYGLCIDPANASRILAVTDKGAYRSTNAGATWSIPVTAFTGTSVLADPAVPGRFFAGAKEGVYESTDGGVQWTKISKGLPATKVTSLTYDVTVQRLVAGTYGSGMYRLSFLPTGVTGAGPLPFSPSLEQNYPNPFNPSTVIPYELPSASRVTLEVCDLLGRRVAVLADGVEDAGKRHVVFTPSTLASGVYIYRLDGSPVGGGAPFTMTKRMILVR
jgi:hypothetical protein